MTDMIVALALCCAMMGAAVGSFLNVVVWRLPAGLSLVRPGSFCPKCKHSIRSFDNIPVFGWIMLRGRCRDCHEPISSRYPMVEAIGAIVALGFFYAIAVHGWTPAPSSPLYWPEVLQWRSVSTAATFFPPQIENHNVTSESTYLNEYLIRIAMMQTAIWSIFFYLLLAQGLIEYDGKRVPRLLNGSVALFICVVSLFSFFLWRQMVGDYETGTNLSEPQTRILLSLAWGIAAASFAIPFVLPHQRFEWFCAVLLAAVCFGGGNSSPLLSEVPFLLPVAIACLLNLVNRRLFKRSCPILLLFMTLAASFILSALHIP